MTARSQRFGVRTLNGSRSSEWVVVWKPSAGDVYLATRTLGGTMKASIHASGRCHVRAPDPSRWRGTGAPPAFLDVWHLDTDATYQFPFSIVVPTRELRAGPWPVYRDKGTIWLTAAPDTGVEVALFFVRAIGDLSKNLLAAGWTATLVDAPLPDGRRLIVATGTATVPPDKQAELAALKRSVRVAVEGMPVPPENPRLLLLTGPNEHGTRKFVEAAVRDEA